MANYESWVEGSPQEQIVGEVVAWQIRFRDETTVPAVEAVTVYKNGSDVTGDVMISGDSHSISTNVVTIKKITALEADAGEDYVVACRVTLSNGNSETKRLMLQIKSESGEQEV